MDPEAATRPKVSVALPATGAGRPSELVELAAHTVGLGIKRIWIGERDEFNAFVLAGAVAGAIPEAELVVGPLPAGVRDPMTLAQGIATVSEILGSSASLAVGASSPIVVSDWHGREWQAPGRLLVETVNCVRALLLGNRVTFEGEFVHLRNVRLRVPCPETEILVAAYGSSSTAAAGEVGDGAVANMLTPAGVASLKGRLEEAGSVPRLSVWVPMAVGDEAVVHSDLAALITGYLRAPGYRTAFKALGYGELVEIADEGVPRADLMKRVPRGLTRAIALPQDRNAWAKRLRSYASAGAGEVVVVPIGGSMASLIGVLNAVADNLGSLA